MYSLFRLINCYVSCYFAIFHNTRLNINFASKLILLISGVLVCYAIIAILISNIFQYLYFKKRILTFKPNFVAVKAYFYRKKCILLLLPPQIKQAHSQDFAKEATMAANEKKRRIENYRIKNDTTRIDIWALLKSSLRFKCTRICLFNHAENSK